MGADEAPGSPYFSSALNSPNRLHLLTSYTINLVVQVNSRAHVIRNNAEPISNFVLPLGTLDVQVPVFFREALNLRRVVFLHQSEAVAITRLVTIRRESF